jgi:hypothetical protein
LIKTKGMGILVFKLKERAASEKNRFKLGLFMSFGDGGFIDRSS